jgi:hypothetical protein
MRGREALNLRGISCEHDPNPTAKFPHDRTCGWPQYGGTVLSPSWLPEGYSACFSRGECRYVCQRAGESFLERGHEIPWCFGDVASRARRGSSGWVMRIDLHDKAMRCCAIYRSSVGHVLTYLGFGSISVTEPEREADPKPDATCILPPAANLFRAFPR